MKTIAKFECRVIEPTEWGTDIRLYAVTGGSKENDQFFESTPSGNIELRVQNWVTAGFSEGKEYYVTFEEV